MPGSTVPEPQGWPSIKTTYESSITTKLSGKASPDAATDKQMKLQAIDYWSARLREDRVRISQGKPPA